MKNILIAVAVLGLVGSFIGGFYVGKETAYVPPIEGAVNLTEGQPEGVDFSLFWDTWRIIQEDYAGADSLDFQAMVYGAIDGMVNSLGDPYTVFLTPEDTQSFFDDVKGSFAGIGVEVDMRDNELRVVSPLEGTPAEKVGLRAGDHIVQINNETYTADISLDEAVTLIRGPVGSKVTLSILREGWDAPRDFEIERAIINIPSLDWEMKEGVAYVKLYQFSEALRSDFARLDTQAFRSTDKIVLDLRNNPGGFLHVAVDVAGWFLSRGDLVVTEDFGEGAEKREYRAHGNAQLSDHKVVVLINGGSASAAEILAGALRDNRNITLIGEKSFGKGSVQEVRDLKDESSLKMTVAKWLTPSGKFITGDGLEPDIIVEMTEEDFDAERDPQLDRAIEVLKNL